MKARTRIAVAGLLGAAAVLSGPVATAQERSACASVRSTLNPNEHNYRMMALTNALPAACVSTEMLPGPAHDVYDAADTIVWWALEGQRW